jgi:PhnB protein
MDSVLSPYLLFNGNCKEAMEFYKSVFGGELKMQTYADMPGTPPEVADRIIHASLENGTLSFMASDAQPSNPVAAGSNINLSIAGNDEAKITEIYNKLSEGGNVTMLLAKAQWGDMFGMVTDKYKIEWMFNIGNHS